MTNHDLANALAWVAIVLSTGVFIAFGFIQWPGLHWDANLYAPPVLNVASGKGWQFGGYTPQLVERTSEAFSFHGVLHVQIFGNVFRTNTWEKFLFWCGLVNAATFCAWTFIFYRTLGSTGHPGLLKPILFGSMAGAIALGLQGRPEHLALLLIALPLILREFSVPTRIFQLAEYALIGLLFTLSPASGVLYGMGVVFWLSLKYENTNSGLLWREFVVVGIMAAAAVILVVGLFCPFSIREWITNILFVSGATFDLSDKLFDFHLGALRGDTMGAPLWNVIVLGVGGLCVLTLLRFRKFIGLVIFGTLAFYSYPKLTDYSYVSFFPLILLFFMSRHEISKPALAPPSGVAAIRGFGSAIAGLYALVLLRLILLGIVYTQHGMSLANAEEKLDELGINRLLDDQAAVFNNLTRPSFIVFGDAGSQFISGRAARTNETWRDEDLIKYEEKYQRKIEYFVYPQSYPGQPPEELYVGAGRFELTYNGWTNDRPSVLGVKLGGPMPGYQLALYQRAETSILELESK